MIEKLRNPATILLCREHRYGDYVVLAHWQGNHMPYVTWRADKDGNCSLGHYFKDMAEAVKDWQFR